jgi:microcompartment protein CcmK/EutM
MRMGNIIGTVTLSRKDETLHGGRFLIVQPHDAAAARGRRPATGETVVIYDELGADAGCLVAFSEGREGAMPFYPKKVPIDAYCSALLDAVELTHGQ